VVVDNILNDLDKAIEYLKAANKATPFRINKEIALAFKSRVALFEGTWEKYHAGTPFAAKEDNSSKFLEIAVQASFDIINGKYGKAYNVYSTGDAQVDYFNLFNQTNLSNNNEILFWRKYDTEEKMGHNSQRYLGVIAANFGLSKSLIDSYLCLNGKPIANSSGMYKGDNLPYEIYENRDPRLAQVSFVKGDPITIEKGDTIRKFDLGAIHLASEQYCPTGFQLKKGFSPENTNKVQTTDLTSTTACIIFRYAEVLLNYVEAKAELGTLNQNDIDKTINTLRDRVGMAHLNMNNITVDPNWSFSGISPIINEIRRERRNELACEGFRFDDIRRWRAHHLVTKVKPLGLKFNRADYPELEEGQNIHLSVDGYVDPYATVLPNGWGFDPEKDYLSPLTIEELSLNTNLTQNPGWTKP
jgi:hypothetical protein